MPLDINPKHLQVEPKEDSPAKLTAIVGKLTKFFLFATEFELLRTFVNALRDDADIIIENNVGYEDKFAVIQSQLDAIAAILASDDLDYDSIQEIVTGLKDIQTSLSDILVNDLTTGGTTKALTAEMGKQLAMLNPISKKFVAWIATSATPGSVPYVHTEIANNFTFIGAINRLSTGVYKITSANEFVSAKTQVIVPQTGKSMPSHVNKWEIFAAVVSVYEIYFTTELNGVLTDGYFNGMVEINVYN